MTAQDKSSKQFTLESYGVRIGIKAEREDILEEVKKLLPVELPERYKLVENESVNHTFTLKHNKKGAYRVDKDGKNLIRNTTEETALQYIGSQIRITVAEFAKNKVFLHAGSVGYKGRSIIIPGRSYQGKTTLVAELIKKGASYYSDEYAVLDEKGFVHPFPKMLSVRGIIDKYTQLDFPVESFGAETGVDPLPVGMVLITEYKKGAKPAFRLLSPGQGIMEMLNHTISIRYKPKKVLEVLNVIANRAIIAKTKRGEAEEFADLLFNFFEKETDRKVNVGF